MAAQVDPTIVADSTDLSLPEGKLYPSSEFQMAVDAEQPCPLCVGEQPLGEVVTLGRESQFPGIGENDRRSSVQSPAMGPVYS
jgi:hypothetical protein